MADSFCTRVDNQMHKHGKALQTQVGQMGSMKLTVSKKIGKTEDASLQRQITVKDFSTWTAETFREFEAVVLEELLK